MWVLVWNHSAGKCFCWRNMMFCQIWGGLETILAWSESQSGSFIRLKEKQKENSPLFLKFNSRITLFLKCKSWSTFHFWKVKSVHSLEVELKSNARMTQGYKTTRLKSVMFTLLRSASAKLLRSVSFHFCFINVLPLEKDMQALSGLSTRCIQVTSATVPCKHEAPRSDRSPAALL